MGSFYHRGRNKSWVFQYYKDGKKTNNETVKKEGGNMEKSTKVKKETQTSKSVSESTSKKSGNTDE